MPLVKKCRHDRSEWRRCGCSWYSEHYNAAGKRVWENVGPRWREARAQHINLEAKAISARSNGRTVVLGTIIDRFMADYHPVSPGTLNALSHRLRVLKAEFGTVPLSRLDLVAIQTYLSANYAPSTAAKTWGDLKRILKYAKKTKLVKKIPEVDNPKWGVRRKAPTLTPEELDRVVRWMNPSYARLAELQLLTGLRIGECLALTSADFELGKLHVRRSRGVSGVGPPKTVNSERMVYLGERAYALLSDQSKGLVMGDLLWNVSPTAAAQYLRRSLTQLGLYAPGRGWHMFRHANTVLRERSGQSLRHAANQLGHGRNYAMTLGYGWAEPTVAEAAAIEALVASDE